NHKRFKGFKMFSDGHSDKGWDLRVIVLLGRHEENWWHFSMMIHFRMLTGLVPSLNLPKLIPKPEPMAAGFMRIMPCHHRPTLVGLPVFSPSSTWDLNPNCMEKIADSSRPEQVW